VTHRYDSTFSVADFKTREWAADVTTGLPIGDIDMVKEFTGDIEGRSHTRFLGGISDDQRTGLYVAMEWFDGTVAGRGGTFAFAHSQTIVDGGVTDAWAAVVPGSGTGALTGITGRGEIRVDADGTHRFVLDADLPS